MISHAEQELRAEKKIKPGHMQDGSTWAIHAERPDRPGYTAMNMVVITKIDGAYEAWEELALKPSDMEVIAKADTLSDIYDAVEDLINNGRPTPLRRAQMELNAELAERDRKRDEALDEKFPKADPK